jgi:hypothetical protein
MEEKKYSINLEEKFGALKLIDIPALACSPDGGSLHHQAHRRLIRGSKRC